ncbi:MAG TPA: Maf family nucleotide pyrophosphatase [Dehalococcoidia bacterium]|nr:Maf family nucleotide pyrophosphatase [Dehalococcoidia bacterium]
MIPYGTLLTVEITGFTSDGDGLAHWQGQEVRVFGALPGETVKAEFRRQKRQYMFAETIEALVASPRRVKPACRYFGVCTGCQWQHVDYTYQLELKTERVREAIGAVGLDRAIVRQTLGAANPFNYRNHARFSVGREGKVGFVHRETRRLVQVDSCLIMDPWINRTLSTLQGRCLRMTQMSIRYGTHTAQWLIQPELNIAGDCPASGQSYYEEKFLGHIFRISSPSFFQVNHAQAEKLVAVVLGHLQPKGTETVVDAYAGVGTFAVVLAPYVARAVAVEESASAIKDARQNVSGLANVELVQSKVEDALALFSPAPDAVILDPPRAGCHPDVLAALGRFAPMKVVYVSCDPETLARDMAVMCHSGFRPVEVQPVDMFPQTHRTECVALLEHEGGTDTSKPRALVLASASSRRIKLLSCLGVSFTAVSPQVNESLAMSDVATVGEKAERSALAKASWAMEHTPADVVVAGDTMVVDEGKVLGKPADAVEAASMLRRLRGKTHQVVTGLAVLRRDGWTRISHVTAVVAMRPYSDAEIEAYVASGDSLDKAGAYGIQSRPFTPVQGVSGCYLNVVGLPLCELARLLGEAGTGLPTTYECLPEECQNCPLLTLAIG